MSLTHASKSALIGCIALACAPLLGACSRTPPQPGSWLGPITAVASPAAEGARYPHLAAGPDGSPLLMSWLQPQDGGTFALQYAAWQHGRWSDARTAATGEHWFVNWADFPSVVPVDARNWAAHWLQQRPGGTYAYDVAVRLSHDAGANWSAPYTPHDDGTPTEHGFVSIAALEGAPHAVWLDGRNTTGEGHDGHDGDAAAGGAMTLRAAPLRDDGPGAGSELDARVCDCCQTDVARTRDGLVVVYRDRSEGEVRDIHAVRHSAGRWSAPVAVHADGWRIEGCPVNGPAVDARDDHVAVAWFTAPDRPRVRLAFSRDGGRSFGSPIDVASDDVLGRVDVVLLEDGRAIVSWLATTAQGAALRVQPFLGGAPAGAPVNVATTDVGRASGFPQVTAAEKGLLFAWTATGPTPRVRTAYAPLTQTVP